MARFRCRACGKEDSFVYDGRHTCPNCGSAAVQFALGVEEIPDDHPLIEAMRRLAEEGNEKNED
ncbi:hypothetical protein SAMN05443247_07807 [Bradyrhizobium erythrophlei]|jgi:hypothetical protein|nr:hypothetical protein SAMN05443247_07807 [Bradyrhizobium erythrophlei]